MQINNNDISFLIIVFSFTLLVMGVFFAVLITKFNQKLRMRQRDSLNSLILGQENERERISRDLHDELGPTLSTIIFTLDKIKTKDSEIIEIKQEAKDKLKDAVNTVRQISHNLASLTLKKYGLINALNDLFDRINKEKKIIYFSSNVEKIHSPEIESHLYKIAQELIQNAKKHSQADKIIISINLVKKLLVLKYSDNGIGFNNEMVFKNGIGVSNIFTRAELMNGKFKIDGKNGFNFKLYLKYE